MHKNQTVNYLSVEHVAKSYGERILFEDISFGINQGQKIGFVAKNGTGKTSLLNILSGIDTPDKGAPLSGVSIPERIFKRDVLPVPFLATNPIFCP